MRSPWPAQVLALGLAWFAVAAIAAPPIPGARSFSAGLTPATGILIRTESGRITLAPLKPSELLGGSSARIGTRSVLATVVGRSLQANGSLDTPPLAAYITRELPAVWRYAPQAQRHGTGAPQVRVEVRSLHGRAGELSLREQPGISIPVSVRASQTLLRGADGTPWYEGSVRLEIPVAAMLAAGTYSGRIEISQESP